MTVWFQRSGRGRETLAAIIVLAGLIVATGKLGTGCKGVSAPTSDGVEAGATAATGVCSLIEGIDDSQVVRTICATAVEVAQIASFILTLRSTDSDAGRAADTAPCKPLPGASLCATSLERAEGILFVTHMRTQRLMLDGGAR